MKPSTKLTSETVEIRFKNIELEGYLNIPQNPHGIVIFAHGSGSSRLSPRNQFVADYLCQAKIGTLLFDLLTKQEEEEDAASGMYRFNISFLAERLVEATDWLVEKLRKDHQDLPIGFFGASTGAAAAIEAAAQRPDIIRAVVSRGGRPDLANASLHKVKAPALLIVGGNDTQVLQLNREAYQDIRAPKDLYIVQGATHLFEEPGALEEVAQAAARWFEKYLVWHSRKKRTSL